eukprot:GAFH01006052.1.p1 GENE.GAFH01006052.1~~GAFH01006052.1.p1  ORF type:complete len:177 (+),score=46.18 GAFH01006052.1:23-532(+)
MRLLAHNFVQCIVPKCPLRFPLNVEAADVQVVERDFDAEFIKRIMGRIDYPALQKTSVQLHVEPALPATLPENFAEDEALLQALHHALNEVVLVKGALVCPGCHRRYPVENTIPNMILRENEASGEATATATATGGKEEEEDEGEEGEEDEEGEEGEEEGKIKAEEADQ